MENRKDTIYSFGEFCLDAGERSLKRNDASIQLAPRVFDTLLLLAQNAGKVISKERMLAEIWDDSFVEENNLAQNVSVLRRVLGEGFIETVPKYGYRFTAPAAHAEVHSSKQPAAEVPETHYARNGDVNIAYQVVGSGAVDIVFVMGWVSHLDYFWKHPLFASFLERLASFSRLILFDKRGTGLSDHVPLSELPTLEQRMEDVHAVMDAVGSDRAVLVGVSEGGPMCSLFAATYPERTAALVMIGTYAKRIKSDDYPWGATPDELDALFKMLRRDWGKPVGLEERAPSMVDDPEFRDWWATYLRMGASPGAVVSLTKMNADIDVRDILPSIRVPTLVIHREGDMCLSVEGARYVASKIPGCRYVELPGIDHLPFVGNQAEILDEIEGFLSGIGVAHVHDRVLATVMHVRAAGGHELSGEACAAIGEIIAAFKGREVECGDGVLATFDGPARAIRCAAAIGRSDYGGDLLTGLHTGECDVVGDVYSGVAVDLAKQIAGLSGTGNILVSRTVKDLVAGSGLQFAEADIASLPGIEGQWRLFTVLP